VTLARVHTFTGVTLDTADLNAEFDNIVNYFGNITAGDTDLAVSTPYPYVVASTGTPIDQQIAAAVAAGKYLYLPEGDYTLDATVLPNGTRIVGAGPELVNIVVSDSGSSTYHMRIGYTDTAEDIHIEGVRFSMPTLLSTNRRLFDIGSCDHIRRVTFKNVQMVSSDTSSRWFVTCTSVTNDATLLFEDCIFDGFINAVGLVNQTNAIFRRCKFISNQTGIQHGTAYSDEEGLVVVEDCYFEIGKPYSSGTHLDDVNSRAIYTGNYYYITDGTNLTALLRLAHGGSGPKLIRDNYCYNEETSSANCYWYIIDTDNAVMMFNCNEGDTLQSITNRQGQITGLSGAYADDEEQIYVLNNFNLSAKDQVFTYASVTANLQRPQAAHYSKQFPVNQGDMGTPMSWDDLTFSIEEYTTGSNVNKLVIRRIDESAYQSEIGKVVVVMSGTTAIYD